MSASIKKSAIRGRPRLTSISSLVVLLLIFLQLAVPAVWAAESGSFVPPIDLKVGLPIHLARDKDTSGSSNVKDASPNFLSTSGGKIVDPTGKVVTLTGVNWFGMETGTFAPHGLWSRNWQGMLDQIAALGYNTIRLPYSTEMLDPKSKPTSVDLDYNPDLEGLSSVEIMDKIIQGARERGLKVILDRHRINKDSQSKLWYDDKYPEERWIKDWVMLAERYRGNDTVIGADLHNEPAGDATWGTGELRTDWRLAAERAGNAIQEVNPDWLIIVEGIEKFEKDWYWMGGSLQGVAENPVRLKVPDKLVYSAHDYGPGVFMQGWFQAKDFPDNLPEVWDRHWGYIAKQGIAPVLLGEFGGRSTGEDKEGTWQRKLIEYLKENGLSYTYWTINPNSGDTGGILRDDWFSIDEAKQALLASYQAPLLGQATFKVDPAAARPKPTVMPAGPSGLVVAFKPADRAGVAGKSTMDLKVFDRGNDSFELKDVELRFWYREGDNADAGQSVRVVKSNISTDAIVAEVVDSPAGNQTHYISVTFKGGKLDAKYGQIDLTLELSRDDGKNLSLGDSWSFRPFKSLKDWDHVGLYQKGNLLWGIEPE